MIIQESMTLKRKLEILSDAAKYDVACTSSGVGRKGDGKGMGNSIAAGICHSFAQDGRCISLPCRSRVKNVSGKKILFGLAPRAVMKDFTENVSRN